MSKVKVFSVDKNEKKIILDEMFEVIAKLRTKAELVEFLVGFLTPSEVLMIGRRMQIAKMLHNDMGYDEIRRKLHVSHATINKIEHWLHDNDSRSRLIAEKIKKVSSDKGNKRTNVGLDKYAHHRFIKDLLN